MSELAPHIRHAELPRLLRFRAANVRSIRVSAFMLAGTIAAAILLTWVLWIAAVAEVFVVSFYGSVVIAVDAEVERRYTSTALTSKMFGLGITSPSERLVHEYSEALREVTNRQARATLGGTSETLAPDWPDVWERYATTHDALLAALNGADHG